MLFTPQLRANLHLLRIAAECDWLKCSSLPLDYLSFYCLHLVMVLEQGLKLKLIAPVVLFVSSTASVLSNAVSKCSFLYLYRQCEWTQWSFFWRHTLTKNLSYTVIVLLLVETLFLINLKCVVLLTKIHEFYFIYRAILCWQDAVSWL